MNYTTKRNIAFSIAIAFFSLLLTAGLFYLIQTTNGSSLLSVTDKDSPVFSYIGSTIGISVAIVASLSTIFLALQAMGIAKEHSIMAAREAYIDDVKNFRNDAHEAERLLLELADKSLEHARAVRRFLIFRLSDFNSDFELFENDADIAREFGRGVMSSALLSAQDEPERRLRLATENIYKLCNVRLPIDWSEENPDPAGDLHYVMQEIKAQIEAAATLHLDTPEDHERFLAGISLKIRSELTGIWRARGEEAVTRSKDALVAAMSDTVRFLLARNRSFMFAELLHRNLAKPEVEKAMKRITNLECDDGASRSLDRTGLDQLNSFISLSSGPSIVGEDDLMPDEIEIPSRADSRLAVSLVIADPFLPRILLRHWSTEEGSWVRPHGCIEYLDADDENPDFANAMQKALQPHPIKACKGNFEFFSFLIATLRDLLDLTEARLAIEAHLISTGMAPDLARTASASYARTIRPSSVAEIDRHVPS